MRRSAAAASSPSRSTSWPSACRAAKAPADRAEAEALRSALSAFLRTLPERQRQVFLARYFYALPLSGIAARFSMRENTVKTTLHRTRRRLRDYLEQEELL